MKKFYFSALILCGVLFTAKTQGQIIIPAEEEQSATATFMAYPETNSNIVRIRWRTFNELNIDHFVVEHSVDSIHFDPMHEVIARGGTANSSYEDADSYPSSPYNYYRLAVVSKDGNTAYSPVMQVSVAGKKMPVLKPTVLHMGGTLQVDPYYASPITINVFNEGGTRVGTYMVNSSYFSVNTTGWGRGIFFYRVSDARHPLIDAGKIMVL